MLQASHVSCVRIIQHFRGENVFTKSIVQYKPTTDQFSSNLCSSFATEYRFKPKSRLKSIITATSDRTLNTHL